MSDKLGIHGAVGQGKIAVIVGISKVTQKPT